MSVTQRMTPAERDLTSRASIIIVTYNHESYIEACLDSVLAEKPAEVLVVDSGSSDGTRAAVEEHFPEVTLVRPDENKGYGAGNNRGVEHVSTEFTVVLNPDTTLEAGCLEALLAPIAKGERRITTPMILTYDGAEINTCGNIDHFTGLGFTRGLQEDPDEFCNPEVVSGLSGACFAVRTDLYRELGGFDESIFLYMEDVELSWRAAAEDVEILYVPAARVLHDYEDVEMTPEKIFHVEMGRYLILRKYLDVKTGLLLAPSLAVTEALTTGYAILQGIPGVRNKLRAVIEGLRADVEPATGDPPAVVGTLATEIPEEQLAYGWLDRLGKRIANRIYRLNHSIVET